MALKKAELEALAAARGVDIASATNNAEREAALEAAGVLKDGAVVPAEGEPDGGGDAPGAAGGPAAGDGAAGVEEASGGASGDTPEAAPAVVEGARPCRGCGSTRRDESLSVCPDCGEEV